MLKTLRKNTFKKNMKNYNIHFHNNDGETPKKIMFFLPFREIAFKISVIKKWKNYCEVFFKAF